MLTHSSIGIPKPGLLRFADPALNQETPPHLLSAPLTPRDLFFVRNNGTLPEAPANAGQEWRLDITGHVRSELSLSVNALRSRFETVEVTAVLECAGNGRSRFVPPVPGLPWGDGAVGCARWTGIRMADVLAEAGVRAGAIYVAHHSPDHVVGAPGQPALSRGLPIAKALARETLLAFAMNGEPLDPLHGFPLRVVAPGFPGSAWQKWLTRLEVLDREHDGAKMTGLDYRMPRRPLQPGTPPDPADFEIITGMPVKSLITEPAQDFCGNGSITIAGHAWGGGVPIDRVEVSADAGANWHAAALEENQGDASDVWAWRRFTACLSLPPAGEVELLARATNRAGSTQPLLPEWNPRGYLNNAVHRVRGRVV